MDITSTETQTKVGMNRRFKVGREAFEPSIIGLKGQKGGLSSLGKLTRGPELSGSRPICKHDPPAFAEIQSPASCRTGFGIKYGPPHQLI
jgi:hypothetical protein